MRAFTSDIGIPWRSAGIYESARAVFHGSEQWEAKIKPCLEFSKAARVFLWSLIIALGYMVMHDLTGWPPYIRVNAQRRLAIGLIGLSQYWFIIYLCLQGVAFLSGGLATFDDGSTPKGVGCSAREATL